MNQFDKQYISSPPIGWNGRSIIAVFALVAASLFVVMALLRVIKMMTNLTMDTGMASPALYISSAVIYGCMFLGVYWFAVRRSGWHALGLQPASWWFLAITPFLLIIELVGMAAINIIIAYIRGESFENPQLDAISGGQPLALPMLLLLLVLIAGFAPLTEELFFRGMLYGWMRQHWGRVVAIVGSAFIFSVMHFIPLIMPALFFIGLILGILREWSKSLVPCIVLHMMQNTVVVLSMNFMLTQT